MRALIATFFLLAASALLAAPDAPIWPLTCKPQLTSCFGEFRVGHFHAGIDFRTPSGEGMPIIAPRDGNIARIRTSPWGYGKVVYYEMSDDIIAVFAHLSAFNERLETRVEEHKLKNKANTAELWFKKDDFAFKAGDTLAFSGSSGAGSAHLHFETRKGWDNNFNPAYLGYLTNDVIPPKISALWAVPWGNNSSINGRFSPVRFEIAEKKAVSFRANGAFYLAVEAFDLESAENANRYGIHELVLRDGGAVIYHFLADTFAYSMTRQIGLLYDLGLQEEFALKRPPLRLKHPFGADIGLLKGTFEGAGIVTVNDTAMSFDLALSDVAGNASTLKIEVKPSPPPREVALAVSEEGSKRYFTTNLTGADTSGLIFEYRLKTGKTLRGRMPIEGTPSTAKGEIEFAQIGQIDNQNPIAFWRTAETTFPAISTSLPGTDYVLIKAAFASPPGGLPLLHVGGATVFPEIENETAFTYRLYDFQPDSQLGLSVSGAETLFTPNTYLASDGDKIALFENSLELSIPNGGTFFPLIIAENLYSFGRDSATVFSIQPAGAMLRSKARITFLNNPFNNLAEKSCIVRVWRGEPFFESAERDAERNLFAMVGALGDFTTAIDTTAPKLEFENKDGVKAAKSLSATMTDDLSGFTEHAHPQSYIDGEWVPTEYDPEKNTITINISKLPQGEHIWRAVARDVLGNAVEKELKFIKQGGGK